MEILVHRTHRAVRAVLLGHDLNKKDCLALILVLDLFDRHHREKIQVCPLTVSDLVLLKATRPMIRKHVKGLTIQIHCSFILRVLYLIDMFKIRK